MRKATLFGKDVYLTEKIWSQLVRRFDVDRARQVRRWGTKFRISGNCFCVDIPCSRCPLYVLHWGRLAGCNRAMHHLCGTSDLAFSVSMHEVSWWEENDKRARRQVQKVYTALMCMEQVKK